MFEIRLNHSGRSAFWTRLFLNKHGGGRRGIDLFPQHLCSPACMPGFSLQAVRRWHQDFCRSFFLKCLFCLFLLLCLPCWKSCSSSESPCFPLFSIRITWFSDHFVREPALCQSSCVKWFYTHMHTQTQLWTRTSSYLILVSHNASYSQMMLISAEERNSYTHQTIMKTKYLSSPWKTWVLAD